MSHKDEKKLAGETEMRSSSDQNVSRLLSNLERVDAPKDFDFHLKARIANASPGDYRPARFFPVLKYALPLALFLLVGAAFVLTNSYSGGNVPPVAEVPSVGPTPLVAPDLRAAVNSSPSSLSNNVGVAENPPTPERRFGESDTKESRVSGSKKSSIRGKGGSIDIAGNGTPPSMLPRFKGSNSNSQRNQGGFDAPRALEVRQMLRNLGVDTSEDSPNTLMVRTVVKDSIGELSGLQVGDLMEAIDDKPIQTLYDGSFTVKSIGVRRDDKVIKINLQTRKP